jgi:Glyoxalase-like domain
MAVEFQVTFDAANPERLGRFWGGVLGYIEQPPPAGFESWDAFLDSVDVPADERDSKYAVVDPAGERPRLLFQKVPEGKTAKNRVHLDVNVGAECSPDERSAVVRARADELCALGASEVRVVEELGEFWIVMQDVEGNEFCVQ